MTASDHAPITSRSAFHRELQLWGPERTQTTDAKIPSLAEAQHYCRQLAQSHYENFSVVSWFVPPSLRQDLYTIYAYCRWSDDLADELDSPSTSTRLLEWWKQELRSCGSGEPMHPVMVALRDTLQRHQLELAPFEDLLSAFLQDQHKLRYENDLELFDYCRRSANPVGRILLQLAGVRDASCLYWSDCICTGLQLANFCQDIANDAARGRIYWPRDRWDAFGLDEKDLLDPKSTSLKQLALSSWVHDARAMLELGRPLATFVPKWLQRDVQLFLGGGLQILDNIARQHYDVWSRRIEVTKLQKVGLIARQFISFHRSSYRAMHSEILSEEVDSDSARLHESHTFAKEICRNSGSSFYRTFDMLRPEKADAMMALYAYARLIDDVVDAELPSDPSLHPRWRDERRRTLEDWRTWILQLQNPLVQDCATLAGVSVPQRAQLHPTLQMAQAKFNIPTDWLLGVIDGSLQDLEPHLQFEDDDALRQYCYRVASTIGLSCLAIWRGNRPELHSAAIECGMAFQITNILRDLREDAQRGRIYLPCSNMQAHHIDRERWLQLQPTGSWKELVQVYIDRAKRSFEQGWEIHQALESDSQRMFSLMWHTYRQLLNQVERNLDQLWSKRLRLSALQKSQLAARHFFSPWYLVSRAPHHE